MSALFPDDLSNLDRLDGLGTRFTQTDANRVLDTRRTYPPKLARDYVAADLPPVDPHGYFAIGRFIGAWSVAVIIFGAGAVASWLIFGVFA